MNYRKWLWAASVFQLITGIIHSLSFFSDPVPANETEKTLMDLMKNYRQNAGAGMSFSTEEIMIALSACFTLICLFGGVLNIFLLRKKADDDLMRGVVLINLVFFGVLFAVMTAYTFLPPMVLTGLIFLCLVVAFSFSHKSPKIPKP